MTNPAMPIILFSAVSALAMATFFACLLARRWFLERRRRADRILLAKVTRSYLKRVGGIADDYRVNAWPQRVKLEAISHIHLLLRGSERERLMQMAELDGLLDSTIRKSRRWRSAKRIDAIRLLQQFGSEACIARLRQMIARDRHPRVRLEAAFALGSIGALPPPREVLRILAILQRKPNRLDRALMRSLAPLYPDQLAMLLDDAMPDEHAAMVIDALGWSGDYSMHGKLEEIAQSQSPELRSASLRAAAKLGGPGSLPWVATLLDDPVPFVRTQAANACAALGLDEAVPRLRGLLEDDDLWVRLRAEHALEVLVSHWPNDETFGAVA